MEKLSACKISHDSIMDIELLSEAAVLVPFAEIRGELHVILEKRSSSIKQPDEICFPGGRLNTEIPETPAQAAIREMMEETGLRVSEQDIFLRMKGLISPFSMLIYPFVCFVKDFNLNSVVLNEREVSDLLIVPFSFFINNIPEKYMIQVKMHSEVESINGDKKILLPVEALELPSFYNKPYGNIKQPVYIWKYGNEKIWGLTARIIVEILSLLNRN